MLVLKFYDNFVIFWNFRNIEIEIILKNFQFLFYFFFEILNFFENLYFLEILKFYYPPTHNY